MASSVLGLDIGGANLKAAHGSGAARLHPFELWKDPARLPDALRGLLKELPAFDLLAVTMTGELCDCFETRRQGVLAILDAVAAVAGPVPVRVWRNDGRLVDLVTAHGSPPPIASANWLALATFAGRHVPRGPALLIDIGSTTTDIVPLVDGLPVPRGRTDPERMKCEELVYTGVRRTPICAVVGGLAAEVFATTLDAYLMLGWLPEDSSDDRTADGRPVTRSAAHARMARMLGADAETCTPEETRKLAERVLLRHVYLIGGALNRVAKCLPGPPQHLVVAGSGAFLVPVVLRGQTTFESAPLVSEKVPILSLTQKLGPAISEAACAYALAVLAEEQTERGK